MCYLDSILFALTSCRISENIFGKILPWNFGSDTLVCLGAFFCAKVLPIPTTYSPTILPIPATQHQQMPKHSNIFSPPPSLPWCWGCHLPLANTTLLVSPLGFAFAKPMSPCLHEALPFLILFYACPLCFLAMWDWFALFIFLHVLAWVVVG